MTEAIDLSDLEDAREEIRDAVMQTLDLALEFPVARKEFVDTVFKLASAASTIERAIEVCGKGHRA